MITLLELVSYTVLGECMQYRRHLEGEIAPNFDLKQYHSTWILVPQPQFFSLHVPPLKHTSKSLETPLSTRGEHFELEAYFLAWGKVMTLKFGSQK